MTSIEIKSSVVTVQTMDDRNRRNLEYLEEDLARHGSVLPFVGAGLSVPLNFPGWTQFLREEAARIRAGAEIEAFIQGGQYEEAAELLHDRLGFREFEDALQKAFGEQRMGGGPVEGHAILSIPNLTGGPVITTNFDRALEKVFTDYLWPFVDKVWGNSTDLLTRAIMEDSHVLLKMHGDIIDRRDRVLTLSEYREHYGSGVDPDYRKPLPQLLRRLFERRPVLFVGCSLNHDRTLRVLKPTATEANMHHYAIVEAPDDLAKSDERRRELSNFGIRAILYPQGQHRHVACLLSYLASLRPGARLSTAGAPEPRLPLHSKGATAISAGPAETRTPSQDFWANHAWSYVVHEQFEEKLAYYLVRIRPYSRESARLGLEKLVDDHGLGTVRVYELFGPYDLMIRAWLPAALINKFDALLASYLHCQGVQPFAANAVHKRWYIDEAPSADPKTRRVLLAQLNRKTIEEVEGGLDEGFLKLLEINGLAFDRTPLDGPTITFFVCVNFEEDLGLSGRNSTVGEITDYLSRNPKLRRITIDRGFGFCEILIKAEADDFYAIGNVPSWIAKRFYGSGAITETYLSKHPVHITGDGRVGSATFDALGGKDIYAAELLPELYPKRKPVHDEVEHFLKRPECSSLGPGARKFVHDFMLGVISGKQADYALVLFRLFSEWESFLRDKHREFLGRRGLNLKDIYQAVNVADKPWENFTFVDVLQILSRGLADASDIAAIGTDWQPLTGVRNAAVHNRKELSDWRSMIQPVLSYWRRITDLMCLVEHETASLFDGTYQEKCKESRSAGPNGI